MSERERWIVYPLLFLALGAALRDKLADSTTTKRIVCQELTVIDENPGGRHQPQLLARIGRNEPATAGTPATGFLFVNGPIEAEVVSAKNFMFQNAQFLPALRALMHGMPIDPTGALKAMGQTPPAGTPPENSTPDPAATANPPLPNGTDAPQPPPAQPPTQ
jgi:hypothetical protein